MSETMKPLTRLLLVSYATIGFGALLIVIAAYAYAHFDVVGLAQHRRASAIVSNHVGQMFSGVGELGFISGLAAAMWKQDFRESWLLWLAVAAFVLVCFLNSPVGTPY